MRTAIDHELVDPKVKTNLEKREQAKAITMTSNQARKLTEFKHINK